MADYKNIADYLQQKRKQANLTQEQLSQVLSAFSAEFSEVDALAISRWERGKVEPSLNRQLELIRYFGDEAYRVLTSEHFSSKNLPSNQTMDKVLEARAKFKHYMGAHPYLPREDTLYQRVSPPNELAQQSCQHLSQYINNLTNGAQTWDPQWLQQLQNLAGAEVSYYFYLGQLAGHCYAIKVKPAFFEQLLDNTLDEVEVTPDMLASKAEPSCLYIYSIYAGRIRAITQIYEQLFKGFIEQTNVAYIGIRIRRDIAYVMLEHIPHTIEAIGPVSGDMNVGIKHHGKRYQYISCKIERKALLNSPVLLNIIRNE